MPDKHLAAVALLLGLLILGLALFWSPAPAERPLARADLPPGGDFNLESADGPVSLRDLRGKVALIYFGYTHCPEICPTALITVADAIEQLEPAKRRDTAVIFVSVDPARDSPDRLARYTGQFHPAIVGVTGTPTELARIASRYGVRYASVPGATAADGYVVDLDADVYVLARDGHIADKISHGTSAAHIASTLRKTMSID